MLSDATFFPISEVCINTVLVFMKEEQYTQVSGVVRLKCQGSRAKIHENPCTNWNINLPTLELRFPEQPYPLWSIRREIMDVITTAVEYLETAEFYLEI